MQEVAGGPAAQAGGKRRLDRRTSPEPTGKAGKGRSKGTSEGRAKDEAEDSAAPDTPRGDQLRRRFQLLRDKAPSRGIDQIVQDYASYSSSDESKAGSRRAERDEEKAKSRSEEDRSKLLDEACKEAAQAAATSREGGSSSSAAGSRPRPGAEPEAGKATAGKTKPKHTPEQLARKASLQQMVEEAKTAAGKTPARAVEEGGAGSSGGAGP